MDVQIRNISSHGMMIECPRSPKRGDYIEIRYGSHVIVGRTMWQQDGRFGIRTQDRLDFKAMVQNISSTESLSAVSSGMKIERRADPSRLTMQQVAERGNRSRYLGSLMQFAVFGLLGVAAAALAASMVWKILSEPLEKISHAF